MSNQNPAELDAHLKERHAWYEHAVTNLQDQIGMSRSDVRARLSWLLQTNGGSGADKNIRGEISDEACDLIIKAVNKVLVELCVKARDNSIQRRSGVIEYRDLLMSIVGSNRLMRSLWAKHGRTSSFEALTLPGRWDRGNAAWNHPAVPSCATEKQAIISCLADEISVMNDTLSYKNFGDITP